MPFGTGGTGGSPPVLVISGDSVITATPSDPTSLVLATPFSYTFSCSPYSPAPVYNQGDTNYPCSSNSTGAFSTDISAPTVSIPTGSNAYVYGSNSTSFSDFVAQRLSIVYTVPQLPSGQTLVGQMYVDGVTIGPQGTTNGHETNRGCGFIFYSNGSNYFMFGLGASSDAYPIKYPYGAGSTLTFDTVGAEGSNLMRMTFFDGTTSNNPGGGIAGLWAPTTRINANVWFGPPTGSGIWPSTTVGVTIPKWPRTYPYVYVAQTYWLPYLSGQGSTAVTISSGSYGVQTFPTPNPQPITVNAYFGGDIVASYSNNLTILPIPITTNITTPLSLITYQPFSYTFSIPSDVQYVTLQSNRSSSALIPYVSSNSTLFSSSIGASPAGSYSLVIDAVLNGNYIAASNITNIAIADNTVIATPAIPSGSLNLYKYEPFSYVFTVNPLSPQLTIQVTNSSSDLRGFCTVSSDGKTVTFAGTPQTSYSASLSLVVDLMYSTTIVSTTTILVLISPGRFFPPVLNQNYQLYQYENISNTFGSNPVFVSGLAVDTVVSIPALPIGLSFGGTSNSHYLQGTPVLQSSQSNYQIIGSNSSNGKLITTIVSMKVNASLVRLTPNVVTVSSMTVGSAITPVTIVGSQPSTIYAYTFSYRWDSLPDGLVFKDINGATVTQPFVPGDSNLTIVLAGTPSLAAAQAVASSGGNSFQVRLSGTQSDQTGKQTTGTALLTFSFDETVLITATNPVTLYQYKPLGTSDVLITANSYFSSAVLSSVTADSLPPGLSLVSVNSTTYRLTGTPTTVDLSSSYTFTATNTNGLSRSTTITIPVNPDVVTFGGTTPANGTAFRFIVSRPTTNPKATYYTTPGAFSATSTSASTPITYSSSISLSTYGLSLNATTGIITGIPTTPLSQTTVTITATDALGSTGTTTILLTILADSFTWPTYTPAYFQNRAITYQFAMLATLSDRTIQAYSSTDLPTGLTISPSGVLSGTPTTYAATGTFNIIATTGYSTISQAYTYTMTKDNILTVQLNSTDQISTIFSNIYFKSILYSSDIVITPTYTISMYPPQYPSPTFSLTPTGNFSGDFTGVAPYPEYLLDVTSTYRTVTTLTPALICLTVSNAPTPNLAIGYSSSGSNYIANTSTYSYTATTAGTKLSNAQVWTDSGITPTPVNNNISVSISSIGPYFVAAMGNYVYDGTYNIATNSISWNAQTPTPAYSGIAVGTDGANQWVVVTASGGPGNVVQLTKTTGGSWTEDSVSIRDSSISIQNTQGTIKYMSPNFIVGSGPYIIYSNAGGISWNQSSFSGFTVSNIAVSNTTLVAIGGTVSSGSPISISTDSGQSWSQVTITSPTNLIYSGGSPIFNDILYEAGKWVMCGIDNAGSNFVAYTTDSTLTTWNLFTPAVNWSSNTTWNSITFTGNAWELGGVYDSNNGSIGTKASRILTTNTWPPTNYTIFSNTLFSNTSVVGSGTPYSGLSRVTRFIPSIFSNGPAVPQIAFIPAASGLSFTAPTQSNFLLYQYVPYSFDFTVLPFNSFIYYYTTDIPIGFQFVLDPSGSKSTLTGISPSNNTRRSITVYAKTATSTATSFTFSLTTVSPFFINPQLGAGAYTAILRNEVEANAAQNARDNRTFPQVDALAGPLMAPRAPDVTTALNCFLKLCKKPCPTCKSM